MPITDSMLGPRVATARDALKKEGASDAEADDLIAQAVLEEAFGYAEDPGHFDAEYLAETLESLAHLAGVTQEKVDEWLENFAYGACATPTDPPCTDTASKRALADVDALAYSTYRASGTTMPSYNIETHTTGTGG